MEPVALLEMRMRGEEAEGALPQRLQMRKRVAKVIRGFSPQELGFAGIGCGVDIIDAHTRHQTTLRLGLPGR